MALAVLLLAFLGGCGADPYPGEPPGTVHNFLIDEIKGLDPAQADEQISNICVANLYDALYEYDYLERPFRLKPCLASAMPDVSDDALTVTIPVRQGVRFQDDPCFPGGRGRELTAHDVVFCLKRLMDARVDSPGTWLLEGYVVGLDAFHEASKQATSNRTQYPPVEGLEALDDHTVRIRLTEPYPALVWVLAMGYTSIYPPEAIARYGDDFLNHAVTTGPYVVKEFFRTQRLVLERNPSYREDLYPTTGSEVDRALGRLEDAGRRLPLNERIVFTVFKETQPQWLYFLSGHLDRTTIPKDNFDVAVDARTMELQGEMAARGIHLEKTPQLEIIYDCFNMKDPVIGAAAGEKGRALRRAMSLATNIEWASEKLYNGRVESVEGILIPEFASYDPSFVNPWRKRPDESREAALARARKLLADVGYADGRGVPTLTYEVTDSTTDRQFFEAFQRDMADIGLTIRANTVTWPQLMTNIRRGTAQIWGVSWGADYPDAQNFLQLFYGPNESPGPNGSNYHNPEFDRLYERALTLPDGEERRALHREMQRIAVEDCPWIFKYRRIAYDLTQPWLHNFKRNDLVEKYAKYLRVDDDRRAAAAADLNRPVLWPLAAFGFGVGILFVLTFLGARRRVRAW